MAIPEIFRRTVLTRVPGFIMTLRPQHIHRTIMLAVWLCLNSNAAAGDEHPSAATPNKLITLPGITINLQDKYVDLDATVCLRDGYLELIACTQDSKEHESLFSVAARPMHVHTALLAIDARCGHPAARRQINDEHGKRWIDVPPAGDTIDVAVLMHSSAGPQTPRPILDFIIRSAQPVDEVEGKTLSASTPSSSPDPEQRKTSLVRFLFAGSLLQTNGTGPREYSADSTGHLMTISTFGDGVLCLPWLQTRDNGSLTWRTNPKVLPPEGTAVTLRLSRSVNTTDAHDDQSTPPRQPH